MLWKQPTKESEKVCSEARTWQLVRFVSDDRIEMVELVPSISGSKAPRNGAPLRIAVCLQGSGALAQAMHTFHAAGQTPSGKNTDLDFGHIEPGFHVWACK